MILLPCAFVSANNYWGLPHFEAFFFKIFGLVFIAVGILIFLYCTKLFVNLGKGTPIPIEPPTKLVTNGWYQYTRNPIYIGYIAIVLGEFFLLGRILLLLYLVVFFLSIHLYLLQREEPKLKKRFNAEYLEYMKRTPRWLPNIFF